MAGLWDHKGNKIVLWGQGERGLLYRVTEGKKAN